MTVRTLPGCRQALLAGLLFVAAAGTAQAAPVNLATLSCLKYQNEVLGSTTPGATVDPIDTVMWLFGYSVGKTGAHVMYGDGLTSFGFALDAECKNNPNESLQVALSAVKHTEKNAMDLSQVDCAAFTQRHLGLKKTDAESAATIVMWLYGFQVGKANGRILDADQRNAFETALLAECAKQPMRNLYDTLSAMKF